MKLLLGLLVLLPSTVFANTLELPLTAEKLYRYLTENNITTKGGLLSHLPDQFNRRVVLVSDSQSRHKGTRELPRVIHWSPGARFIMAHSGHGLADDPQANEIEIIQVDKNSTRWQFLTMRLTEQGFAAPVDVTESCSACHGATPRPIWGSYPRWPHAYQGSLGHDGVDRMAPEERQAFSRFMEAAPDSDAYSHLNISVRDKGYRIGIPYNLPNTHFGARLGSRHAAVIFHELRQSPYYADHAYQLLRLSRTSRCHGDPLVNARVWGAYSQELEASGTFRETWADRPTSNSRVQLYRLMGIDVMEAIRLDRSPVTEGDLGPRAQSEFGWSLGSDSVGALVEFQMFYDLLQTDAQMQAWFSSRRQLIDGTYWSAFEATGDDIVAMSQRETGFSKRLKALNGRRYEMVSQSVGGGELADIDAQRAALWAEKHDERDYFRNGLFPFLHFNIFAPVLETEYTHYVPISGEGHGPAYCTYLTQKALGN